MASARNDPTGQAGDGTGSIPATPGTSVPPGLEAWGLPPDVASRVQQMLQQGYSIDEILAYIRGTPWYAQTYPGIQQGIALGLIGNEADYRSYLNQANQLYRRYYGRDISSNELAGFLTSGVSLGSINEQLQAGALYKTMFGESVDPATLTTILSSGISPGSYLQVEASFRQLFGRDATPDEISLFLRSGASTSDLQAYNQILHQYTGQAVDPQTLAGLLASGTSPQALEQQYRTQGDVTRLYQQYGAALPANAVQDLLAGRTDLNQLQQQLQAKADLTRLYQQYGGSPPSKAVADLLAGRTDLNTIQQQLEGKAYIGAYAPDIQGALGAYGAGVLSDKDLQTLGEQTAGHHTPLGFKLQRALDQAMKRMQGVFHGSLATPAGIGIGRLGLAAPPSTGPPDVGR